MIFFEILGQTEPIMEGFSKGLNIYQIYTIIEDTKVKKKSKNMLCIIGAICQKIYKNRHV